MKRIFLHFLHSILTIWLATASACCNNIIDGNSDQFVWKTPLSSSGLIFADMPVTVHSRGVLFAGEKNGSPILYFLDKGSGKVLWEWSDFMRVRENILVNSVYFYENNLAFQSIDATYLINLESGKTISKINTRGQSEITGIGKSFFTISNVNTVFPNTIFQGDIENGLIQPIYTLAIPDGFRAGLEQPTPFITQNGDTMLVMITTKVRNDNSAIAQSTLLCYNLTQRRILYDSLQQDVGSVGLCVVANNKIYLSGGATIRCHDLATGKLIWRQEFTAGFLFSGIIVADGKVFGACEDTNLYGLDAETGRILWKHPIAGTTRRPFYMNGVVYISKGKLYAVDATTGEILWNRECPEQAQNSSVYFFGYVTGSEGKIYCQSYKSAYCYKAAR